MSTSHEPQEQIHVEEHKSLIKTPKQLIITVILSFVIPIAIIIMLANWVTAGDRKASGSDTLGPEATATRIAPVARIEIIDVSAPAELKSGEQVYNLACASCHAAGVAGSPKFGDQAAWSPRIATGLDALTLSTINGKGAMPARGGNPTLQDLELTRAVVYMANAAGGSFEEPSADAQATTEPPAAPADPAKQVAVALEQEKADDATDKGAPALPEQTVNTAAQAKAAEAEPAGMDLALGERIYTQACAACHNAGIAGAPKLGDKAAWAPRIATGMPALVQSVIKGKGIMPARGGMATASDEDLAAAVHFMVKDAQ
jgi:cytochrome c5